MNFKSDPMLSKKFDKSFLTEEIKLIAGIDEAGRGPLAGPVVAAAVIFENGTYIGGVKDSKVLDFESRGMLFEIITQNCISYGVEIIDHLQIEEINILQATLLAMKKASEKLSPQPNLILIDGNKSFTTETPVKTIVSGDSKSFAIAAASIIAKVTRDRIMIEASKNHPEYNWHRNKGYATKEHIAAIKKYGPTPFHRKKFLRKILNATEEELSLLF